MPLYAVLITTMSKVTVQPAFSYNKTKENESTENQQSCFSKDKPFSAYKVPSTCLGIAYNPCGVHYCSKHCILIKCLVSVLLAS